MKEIKITIDSRNLGCLKGEVEKLNKELARYNYPLLTYTYEVNNELTTDIHEYLDCTVFSDFEKENLIGETVHFEGTIEYMKLGDDNTKIMNLKDSFISDYMKNHVCTCDECKKNITRGKYIVFSKDVDEVKSRNDFYILGTKCAKAYFPFNIESYINRVDKVFDEIEQFDEISCGGRSWGKTHLNPYKIAFATNIVTNGTTAKYDKFNTIDEVSYFYSIYFKSNKTHSDLVAIDNYLEKNSISVNAEDLINNAKEYYNNLKYCSDFDYNCKTLLNNMDSLDLKYFGRFVSAIIFGNIGSRKVQAREEEHKKSVELSNYVGEVGAKFDNWKLTFKKVFSFENQWGFTNIYKFVDSNNNTIVWSTQKSIYNKDDMPLNDGDIVTLKGTIKEHKLYRDEKQTCITRCKIL